MLWNEDEGVDMSDHTATSISHHTVADVSQSDTVNGTDSDYSDAGRCVSLTLHANDHSAVCLALNSF